MKYDIKRMKEIVLLNAGMAYGQIWRTDGIDTSLEEELVLNAIFKVLDEDTGSREQFEELLGIAYMFQGIADSMRSMCKTVQTMNESTNDKTLENKYPLLEDDYPF